MSPDVPSRTLHVPEDRNYEARTGLCPRASLAPTAGLPRRGSHAGGLRRVRYEPTREEKPNTPRQRREPSSIIKRHTGVVSGTWLNSTSPLTDFRAPTAAAPHETPPGELQGPAHALRPRRTRSAHGYEQAAAVPGRREPRPPGTQAPGQVRRHGLTWVWRGRSVFCRREAPWGSLCYSRRVDGGWDRCQ